MKYFKQNTLDFLKKLVENNNTNWFNNNKSLFEENVKTPFQNFIEDICQDLEKSEKRKMAPFKECIFRLNRDIRFSNDKSTYKTFVSALVSPFGKRNRSHPGLYIQISCEEVRIYSGSHDLSSTQLSAVRQKIYDEPKRFKGIISEKDFLETFGELKGEYNKKIPYPFSELMNEIPQIAYKEFYCFTKLPSKLILQDSFKKEILNKYSICKQLNIFLREAIE